MQKRRILIDARFFTSRTTGVGRYLRAVTSRLLYRDWPDLTFEVLANSPSDWLPPAVSHTEPLDFSASRALTLSHQFGIPRIVRRIRPDLYHYPMFDPPVCLRRPFVATCYDLEPLRHPEYFSFRVRAYYAAAASFLRRASRIIAISQNTAEDLTNLLGIPRSRIDVALLGFDSAFASNQVEPGNDELNECPVRPPYALYVGNLMAHKNVPRLLAAIKEVRQALPELQLVIVAPADKHSQRMANHPDFASGARWIHRFEGITDVRLGRLYSNASVYVQPSLYEGFGLPALEAMSCGAPVAASRVSSLPEILGDAAWYFDPLDVSDMARAITAALSGSTDVAARRAVGMRRAAAFTWERCVDAHVASYRAAFA